MDTSNWRPTQGGSGAGGDSSMESGDWRAQLQADSRQRSVNKIMDTLKGHLPFSGHEGQQELKKIAVRFEEKIYTAATSESDYLRKIVLKLLTMENRSQNPMPDAMQSNSADNSLNPSDPGSQVMQHVNNQGQPLPIPVPSNHPQPGQQLLSQSMHNNIGSTGMQASLDSTAHTGNPNGGDWQEEVYQKIQAMKDLYLLDLNDMHQRILGKLQQHDSLPQQPKNEQFEKLNIFKNMLERFMQFLQIPKNSILLNYKDKLSIYEKQIVNVINSNRRKPAPSQQQAQALPPPHMHSVQQSQQIQPHENQMSSQMQAVNLQSSMAATYIGWK